MTKPSHPCKELYLIPPPFVWTSYMDGPVLPTTQLATRQNCCDSSVTDQPGQPTAVSS